MEPTADRPRGDDDRRTWMPLVAVVALIAVVFLAVYLAFRSDDGTGGATGTLPASFPSVPATASTVPTTTAPPSTSPPPPVTTARRAETGGGATKPATTTTVAGPGNPRAALQALSDQLGASVTSDVVTMGSDLYAMLVVGGNGDVRRWDGDQWVHTDTADAPGIITKVQVADVTGDGTRDFVVTLSGINAAGGVYSRQTFQFQFLPFNTTTGLQEFVNHLVLNGTRLQSAFVDSSGARTLTWTWTGRMFETG
jgi:hypothetical protein